MHERVKTGKLVEAKATEGFIFLDALECVLSVGADRDDLALALD